MSGLSIGPTRIAAILLALLAASFPMPGHANGGVVEGDSIACEGCPDFVSVPAPPAKMRRISHVARTELTWNQYLAAYDAGACGIPRSDHDLLGTRPKRELDDHVELFRIDWPATLLGPSEIQCYANWLSTKLKRKVAVPTAAEWLWFARSGEEGLRFPWGNDPEAGRAAIGGMKAIRDGLRDGEVRVPYPRGRDGRYVHPHLAAIKVAQYPPTEWGLYDVFGNAWELTADISAWGSPDGSPPPAGFGNAKKARIIGQSHGLVEWQETGLEGRAPNYVVVAGDRYSASVAVRFVLVD